MLHPDPARKAVQRWLQPRVVTAVATALLIEVVMFRGTRLFQL